LHNEELHLKCNGLLRFSLGAISGCYIISRIFLE